MSSHTAPRIVSAKIKNSTKRDNRENRPVRLQMAGLVQVNEELGWKWKYAEVQNGCLLLYDGNIKYHQLNSKIQLRNISLKSKSDQLTLHSKNHTTPLVTFKVQDDRQRGMWFKCLCKEILTQTPLKEVRYIDIFDPNIPFRKVQNRSHAQNAKTKDPKNIFDPNSHREPLLSSHIGLQNGKTKDLKNQSTRVHDDSATMDLRSKEQYAKSQVQLHTGAENECKQLRRRYSLNQQPDVVVITKRESNVPDVLKDLPFNGKTSESVPCNLNSLNYHNLNEFADDITNILNRCYMDKHVPVKEKTILFESLNAFSCSVDNLLDRSKYMEKSPYRSLGDLNCSSPIPVKDMCRYFEAHSRKKVTSCSILPF